MARTPYDEPHYRRKRRLVLESRPMCSHCKRERATQLDHWPPLAMHAHRENTSCCRLIPVCEGCNQEGGNLVRMGLWRPDSLPVGADPEPEPGGLDVDDKRWRVPWLRDLRRPPDDAAWPRLMSVPHKRAAGSLGPEFVEWAQAREGKSLRWWQQLVAARLLEVDEDGRLCWEAMVLSMPRQLGKSWLLRELCLWRIHQHDRFGEPQDVLHTGKDLGICKEVQRPARVWAKRHETLYRVRETNGQEEIEHIPDGSRYLIRAKEAVYGYSVSLAVADESWKVQATSIDEGLTPTMVEREQPQLMLVSTAHRLASSLMLTRRRVALEGLEKGDGDLLIEWSAPRDAELEDRTVWRQASAHWSPRRERMIAERLEAANAGKSLDPDEPDPVASFRAQWLNEWPQRLAEPTGPTVPLLADGLWQAAAEQDVATTGPIWVALEDDYGKGAAAVAAGRTEDGRIQLDGLRFPDWDAAVDWSRRLADSWDVRGLLVGASLMDRMGPGTRPRPTPAGSRETRIGLSLIRDLAHAGVLVHDTTTADLDQAMTEAMVRESPTGLTLVARGPTHLLRAAVWAAGAAHRPAPAPAIL